jgi:hypothetical protein
LKISREGTIAVHLPFWDTLLCQSCATQFCPV